MTPQEIDEIEMRALAATREPWHVEYLGDAGYPQRVANDAAVVVCETHDGSGKPAANAEFIAAVRTDVLRLIAEVRRLPAEGDRREEWGIWWHSGDSDGIVLAEAQIGSRERAERRAKERIGEYGITRYTLRRCEHRVWADGTTLIGPWTSVEEPA